MVGVPHGTVSTLVVGDNESNAYPNSHGRFLRDSHAADYVLQLERWYRYNRAVRSPRPVKVGRVYVSLMEQDDAFLAHSLEHDRLVHRYC